MGGEEGAGLINGVAVRENVHEPLLKHTKSVFYSVPKLLFSGDKGRRLV